MLSYVKIVGIGVARTSIFPPYRLQRIFLNTSRLADISIILSDVWSIFFNIFYGHAVVFTRHRHEDHMCAFWDSFVRVRIGGTLIANVELPQFNFYQSYYQLTRLFIFLGAFRLGAFQRNGLFEVRGNSVWKIGQRSYQFCIALHLKPRNHNTFLTFWEYFDGVIICS